jgi:tetratricopeptide (TPR) repeat protein
MPHVRLAMITRNEAATLPALAKAVDGLIDSWIIVDNGPSTDGTPRVARDVFGHLPGTVHQSALPQFDFAAARNELLDLASEPGVYLMLLDPDSPPVGRFNPSELTEPVYTCVVRDRYDCEWHMPFLVNSDLGARYVGRAHEYLDTGETPLTLLPGIHIHRKGAGATRARHEWYLEVLADDPTPRAAFYIANTLRDLGRTQEAVEAYVRRAGMTGNAQETFWSIYQVGCLLEPTDPATARRVYLDAFGYRPSRAEPLHHLARLANNTGEHHTALAYAEKALTLPPSSDELFVERWIERWGTRFQWAVAHWWAGDRDQAYETFDRLIAEGQMNSQHQALARRNLALQEA